MSDSLQSGRRAALLASACCAALLLAGCGGDDAGPAPPTAATPATATALAVSQINGQTCDNNDPQAVNDLQLSEDDDPTDVTMLTPACTTP